MMLLSELWHYQLPLCGLLLLRRIFATTTTFIDCLQSNASCVNVVSIIVLQDGQWTVGDVLEDVSSTDVYQTLLRQHRHTGRT